MDETVREPLPLSPASRQIVAIAAERDREAFAALFAYFAPRVKSYLLRLGAKPALAEDLAQETLLTVWRKAAHFDPAKAQAAPWIFTIARNLRISELRRERRPGLDPADPTLGPAAPASAEESLAAAQRESRIHAALATLPDEQAAVVRLSFFEDKPHQQIERDLGIPLGTVKSRLRLAMARIRRAIGEE
jgi:RNA polymerase sigma-70 factor (ECF subfamily)